LYTDMRDADELIEAEKRRLGNSFYKLKVVDFKGNGVVVPRPTTFNANSFPDDIKNHIDQNISKELSYTFSLLGRSIRIRFFVENSNAELFIDKYNAAVPFDTTEQYLDLNFFFKEFSNLDTKSP